MNYIKLLCGVLAISVVAFSSCKKKEKKEPVNTVKTKLVGYWQLVRSGVDANGNKIRDDSEMVDWPDSMLYTVTFNADGTGSGSMRMNGVNYPSTFTWALNSTNTAFTIAPTPYSVVFGASKGPVYIDKLDGGNLEARVVPTTFSTAPALTIWYIFKELYLL